jgi:hypothetical protein
MPPGNPPGHPVSDAQWVYRQGDLVLGPVGTAALEEMLLSGRLPGHAEVAPAGSGSFRPVGQHERFRVTVAKAEAKLRVEAAARAEREARRRRQLVLLGAVGAAALVAAVGAGLVARYLAVHAPFRGRPGAADISMEAPVIRLAQAGAGEELLEYGQGPGGATGSGPGGGPTGSAGGPAGARGGAAAGQGKGMAGPGRKGAGTMAQRMEASGADGMETATFDQAAINAVVAEHQRTLYPCLQEAAEENPEVGGRVPIEFVIGNDGRVVKVWVDRNELKQGGLQACLLRELQKWPFPRIPGESPSVGLVFNLGRRAAQ